MMVMVVWVTVVTATVVMVTAVVVTVMMVKMVMVAVMLVRVACADLARATARLWPLRRAISSWHGIKKTKNSSFFASVRGRRGGGHLEGAGEERLGSTEPPSDQDGLRERWC